MIQIPALRLGQPYTSLEKATLVHHITGEPVAEVSQVTGSAISRDLMKAPAARKQLPAIPVGDPFGLDARAAAPFLTGPLPSGDARPPADHSTPTPSAPPG